jgi:hypothetical protein
VLNGDGHWASSSLCHDYYTLAPLSSTELDGFLDRLAPEQFAVNITAKAGMPPAHHASKIERRLGGSRKREMPSSEPLPGAECLESAVASWCAPPRRSARTHRYFRP